MQSIACTDTAREERHVRTEETEVRPEHLPPSRRGSDGVIRADNREWPGKGDPHLEDARTYLERPTREAPSRDVLDNGEEHCQDDKAPCNNEERRAEGRGRIH
jgi:hypothetical protein